VSSANLERFRAEGFLVLRDAFDPGPLADEIDAALRDGLRRDAAVSIGGGGAGFQAVIMMCELTPVSLALLDQLALVASTLLDADVIPGRAKGTRYTGSTDWHRDSELPLPDMSFVAYLESLDAACGALQVRPRSHLDDHGAPSDAMILETEPGDLIAFDAHLLHASFGGSVRRQWRVDFGADPANEREEALVTAEYARMLGDARNTATHVELYPSFGPFWRSLDRPWNSRLAALGVYELADAYHAAHLGSPHQTSN